MSKMKYKIALAAAAVLLLGGVIYIYFAHYAPFKPDEAQTLSVWYVNDDAMWSGFNAMCGEYNETNGADCGITISTKAFDTQAQLYESVCSALETEASFRTSSPVIRTLPRISMMRAGLRIWISISEAGRPPDMIRP